MYLLSKVESYLRATGMPQTRFGREVAADPRLVHDLRNGRTVGPKLAKRVVDYLEAGQ